MITALREKCTEAGFDLCDVIHTQWYNDLIEKEGHVTKGTLKKISTPPTISENNENSDYNAVLIGNSKSVWPKFIKWLLSRYEEILKKKGSESSSDNEILNQVLNDNPFDTFVTNTLLGVFQSCLSEQIALGNEIVSKLTCYEFYWSNGAHYKVPIHLNKSKSTSTSNHPNHGDYHCFVHKSSSFLLSMQRAAKVTGKYWHDEDGTKLCVHPKFGTWKAFRAVVVFHTQDPNANYDKTNTNTNTNTTANTADTQGHTINMTPQAPPMCPCPVDPEEIRKAKKIMEYALQMSGSSYKTGCYGGGSSLCKYLHHSVSSGSDWSKVSPTMRPWIQLRDCISLGRENYKYCDNQILYHYTKDPNLLKQELKSFSFEKLPNEK